MIAFSKLGSYGRLGNQLFQYAYIRALSKRLSVPFYCPHWVGEDFFDLQDEKDKCRLELGLKSYNDQTLGYSSRSYNLSDGFDVTGFFQSDSYFEKKDITTWFTFKREVFSSVNNKYTHIEFSKATALHVRLGDYTDYQLVFYTPRPEYFMKGLKYCKSSGAILVFTDDVVLAKEYLKQIDLPMIYITGNKDYEDLYLMHLCKNIICSPSSFSWWAAYLNAHHDKKIVVPQFWFLPGGTAKNEDIFVHGWKRIRAHRWYDYYYIRYIPNLLLINHKRVRKVLGILSSKIRARI